MATYIQVNGNQYPALITGRLHDKDWDDRASKAIQIEMAYQEALNVFVDDIEWKILQDIEIEEEIVLEDGIPKQERKNILESYDNSEYCIAGDIIDHRNGTITVKMGKPTAEELLALLEEVL